MKAELGHRGGEVISMSHNNNLTLNYSKNSFYVEVEPNFKFESETTFGVEINLEQGCKNDEHAITSFLECLIEYIEGKYGHKLKLELILRPKEENVDEQVYVTQFMIFFTIL